MNEDEMTFTHEWGKKKVYPEDFYGRKITDAKLVDDKLILSFEDGTGLKVWDSAQDCCEIRYTMTDDDPSDLIGHTLTRLEVKEGPETTDEYYEVHETAFVEVGTDKNFITLVTHNEHNGYYGGFALTLSTTTE